MTDLKEKETEITTQATARRFSSQRSQRSQRSWQDASGDRGSIDSNAVDDNPGKLEEDVRFPMEHHLMQTGSHPRVHELDALRSATTDAEPGAARQRFTLVTGIMGDTAEAPSLSLLLQGNRSWSSLLSGSSGIWWLDCYNASDHEIRALARAFDIHPLTTEDILTQDSLEKFEMFANYAFVAYKTFCTDADTGELEPVRFYAAVFRGGILTFYSGHDVDHSRRVRTRMHQLHDWVKVSPVWICYALLDDITDGFEPVMASIENEAAYVEKAVFVDNGTSEIALLLGRLGQARQKTMSLVRLLYGKTDVVRGFIKGSEQSNNGVMSGEIALYLGDIRNRLDTIRENLLSYEGILSRSHNSFMGILQVEYVNSNTRMTTLLGKVTIIGTVLVPINLVFGAWGMNVPVPGGNSTGLGWFFGIVGIILFVVAIIFVLSWWYFRRVQRTQRAHSFV